MRYSSFDVALEDTTRWIEDVIDEMDSLFKCAESPVKNRYWAINKDQGTYTLDVELPGYDKADVSLSLYNSSINVDAKNAKRKTKFQIGLPIDSDHDSLQATLVNGIITLTIHKKSKEKKIEIK